ncbi:hypothetical protein [Mycobacterium sp. NPDC050853]|uniref:hypothetical protein n=1 Tax=Mycobacterium sp. NPDC050853 TaxID=3155160 RepID=UPI0033EC28A4
MTRIRRVRQWWRRIFNQVCQSAAVVPEAMPHQPQTAAAGSGTPVVEVADIAAHALLAEQFRSLAEQDIQHLARMGMRADGLKGRLAVAQRTAELCRQLCAGPYIMAHSDELQDHEYRDRKQQIQTRLDALLEQGTRHGGTLTFDFTAATGVSVTPRQQLWSMCEQSGDVAFVVIPAYCVDGQLLSQQVVYTH